jgi:hypothetical protein
VRTFSDFSNWALSKSPALWPKSSSAEPSAYGVVVRLSGMVVAIPDPAGVTATAR